MSVDVLALRFDRTTRRIELGIAARAQDPFRGQLALPGVLLGLGERLHDAALRALTGKLGVAPDAVSGIGQLVTFDKPNRDPRGPTLSIAMWAGITQPAESAVWTPFDRLPELAFDHQRIVEDSRELLAGALWRDTSLSRALTGRRFPTADALDITATLTGRAPDRGNLNRTLKAVHGLHRTEERVAARSTGRPAAVWEWDC